MRPYFRGRWTRPLVSESHLKTACYKFPPEDFRLFGWQSEDRFIFLLIKTKLSVHMMFGMVTYGGNVMSLFIFTNNLRVNTGSCKKCLDRGSAALDRKGGCLKTFRLEPGTYAISHKLENLVLFLEFSAFISSVIWPPGWNRFDYYLWERLREWLT